MLWEEMMGRKPSSEGDQIERSTRFDGLFSSFVALQSVRLGIQVIQSTFRALGTLPITQIQSTSFPRLAVSLPQTPPSSALRPLLRRATYPSDLFAHAIISATLQNRIKKRNAPVFASPSESLLLPLPLPLLPSLLLSSSSVSAPPRLPPPAAVEVVRGCRLWRAQKTPSTRRKTRRAAQRARKSGRERPGMVEEEEEEVVGELEEEAEEEAVVVAEVLMEEEDLVK